MTGRGQAKSGEIWTSLDAFNQFTLSPVWQTAIHVGQMLHLTEKSDTART